MVSIRSDDIRGRWGRLIDNTASFTSLDLSGQASSILVTISGQALTTNVSGLVSGFSIGPTTIVAGSATFSQVIVQSGLVAQQISGAALNVSGLIFGAGSGINLTVSGITSSVISGSTLNLQSGAVAGAVTVSGTTLLQGVTTIGAGASGISFSGLQMLPTMGPSQVIVWASGSSYRAGNTTTGQIVSSGTDPEIVVAHAITNYSDISIHNGTYILSSTFSGIGVGLNKTIRMGKVCLFLVPAGYSGIVFDMGTNVNASGVGTSQSIIDGGYVLESGLPTNPQWIGLRMICSGAIGIYDNIVENIKFDRPGVGIKLMMNASGGFINNNIFKGVKIYHSTVGVWFQHNVSGYVAGNQGTQITNNTFDTVMVQSNTNTSGGFIDIQTHRNAFVNCQVWDINIGLSGAKTSNFHTNAIDNVIVGGIMRNQNFTDEGSGNVAVGEFGTTRLRTMSAERIAPVSGQLAVIVQNQTSGQTFLDIMPATSGQTSNIRIAGDSFGASGTFLQLQNAAGSMNVVVQRGVSGSALKTLFYSMVDSVNNTSFQYMNVNRSGTITFGQSGGALQCLGTVTYSGATNFAGTNIMSGTTGIFGMSGLNWTGVFTSGGVSGGSGASYSGMIPQGYLNLQISGSTVKIPFFN